MTTQPVAVFRVEHMPGRVAIIHETADYLTISEMLPGQAVKHARAILAAADAAEADLARPIGERDFA